MQPAQPPAGEARDDTLLALADAALAAGELEVAAARYRRVLQAHPASARAHLGLGAIALRRGDLPAARRELSRARELDPEAPGVHLELAALAVRSGDAARAREHLVAALRLDRGHPAAHAELARLTGPAPRRPAARADRALARADAHPYDPKALRAAGEALLAAGRRADGLQLLEKALWLADRDPRAAARAVAALRVHDPAWRERRVLPVHVRVDAAARAVPGWRFQIRSVWLFTSEALLPLLDTRFLVVSLEPLDAAAPGASLDALHEALPRGSIASEGLVAGFTGRPAPRQPGAKLGLADYLGRAISVRLAADERRSRALAHEILHVYGGIHVLPSLPSLMNPAGDSYQIDPMNQRLVRALRGRGFAAAGFEADVLARVELGEAITAYEEALRANLLLRRQGVAEALEEARRSRYLAARRVRRTRELDPHLGDVCRALSLFLLAAERRTEALVALETAARLYGERTPAGRDARGRADRLRGQLERLYRLD